MTTPAEPSCPQTLAQSDDSAQPFHWNGRVAPDQLIEIGGIRDGIDARAAVGGELAVAAINKVARSQPAIVPDFVAQRVKDVQICALHPKEYSGRTNIKERRNRPAQSAAMGVRNYDVRPNSVAGVPSGVEFVNRTIGDKTINDEIKATWLSSNSHLLKVCPTGTPLVDSYSVNGLIKISTGYPQSMPQAQTQAQTLRGEINPLSGDANCADAIELKTSRGTIAIDLLQLLKANLEGENLNSDTVSDFPRTRKILIQRFLQAAPAAAEDSH